MQPHEYETMRSVEDTYWWYRVLRRMVAEELAARLTSTVAILDAGCGTGGMMTAMRTMHSEWRLTGCDLSPQAVELTKARGFQNVRQGSVDNLPDYESTFDAVVSLDVICSSGVDRDKAVRSFHRVLKPGGSLVLNLPAFECLRGSHDSAVAVEKRFTRAEVESMLADAGFEIEVLHFWNAWLFAPIFIWRQVSRLFVASDATEIVSDLHPLPAVMNDMLATIGNLDARLSRMLRIPFGTSVFCVASKRKGK